MKQDEPTLDHDMLAAYISNSLPPDDRAAVTRLLVRNPEARELLAMAARAIGDEKERHRDHLRVETRDRSAERAGTHRSTGSDRNREKTRK